MMLALLLATVLAVAEGDPLLHPPSLQLLHLYNDHQLSHDLLNDIHPPHPSPEFFQYVLNHHDQLPAVETHRLEPSFTTTTPGDAGDSRPTAGYVPTPVVSRQHSFSSDSSAYSADEGQKGEGMMLDPDTGAMESLVTTEGTTAPKLERRKTTAPSTNKDPLIVLRRKNSRDKPHRRQKRFILGNKLRTIAVPLSVFNFLGFLPVRVPGLPYHNDLPSPDYSYYNTMYEIYVPRRRRRFRFYD